MNQNSCPCHIGSEMEMEPGYQFDESRGMAVWTPGLAHPEYPNVLASEVEPKWIPAPGYYWADEHNDHHWLLPGDHISWTVRKRNVERRIVLPDSMNSRMKVFVAMTVAMAARADIRDDSDLGLDISFAQMSLLFLTSDEGFRTTKAAVSGLLETAGLSDLTDMDSEDERRESVIYDMFRLIEYAPVTNAGDQNLIEQYLNEIHYILESCGSRIHKTGALGSVWLRLLRGDFATD